MKAMIAALALACITFSVPARADLVDVAARYEHTNPVGWAHNSCARGLNQFVLRPLGLRTGNDLAGSFLDFPRTTPHRNALAVLGYRGRATHVAIVEAIGPAGVAIISFNWSHHLVGRGLVPRSEVLAFVDAPKAGAAASVPWPIRSIRMLRHHKGRVYFLKGPTRARHHHHTARSWG